MSNLLQIKNASKSYGSKVLFEDAQFSINENEHVGVIGPNGAGKTTLFKILTEHESLDDGQVIRSKSLRLGYLPQHDRWKPDETVEEYLSRDCEMPLWELQALGNGLGLTDEMYSRPIQSLSGGYRMRCKLLGLIGQEPNLMLLDEPTNYLDLETTLVLEKFLQDYSGAFLLISHDREFLQRTTDHILEVEGDIIKYNGNLEDYFEQKALLRSQLEAQALQQQQKKKEILDFVARFGAKATKARQAQSRLKNLEKMETIELKALPVKARIKIPPPSPAGKTISLLEGADLGYPEKVILKNVRFRLMRGDHVAIVGLNGAGKSTFLKTLAGKLAPLKGHLEMSEDITIGYYAQHVAEALDASGTVLSEMMAHAHPDITPQDGLNMAGSLLFSGSDIKKPISVLSGGEKSRVALGQILLQRAACLILDEPTNHLDFQTVEALTQALASYAGTVVIVSHDRSFIRRGGKTIVEVNSGSLSLYPGTYDEYIWSLQNGTLSNHSAQTENVHVKHSSPTQAPQKQASASTLNREEKKQWEKELKKVTRRLAELDSELSALQTQIESINLEITTQNQPETLKNLGQKLGELQKAVNFCEEQWIEQSETKEKLVASIGSS